MGVYAMKRTWWVIGLAIVLFSGSFLVVDLPVAAAGGYYGGGYYHGGYYGGTHVYIGGGWGWPGWGWGWGPGWWGVPYAYPYYGAPPVVVQPPTRYIQQALPPAQYWYYCSNPQGYYLYVKECPVPWIPVPPQPAAAGAPPTTP